MPLSTTLRECLLGALVSLLAAAYVSPLGAEEAAAAGDRPKEAAAAPAEEVAEESPAVEVEAGADGPNPAEGHSYHGEAFNEGPRQRAYLMGNTGKVDFPVTTKNEECRAFVNQGVGQLHGFWYLEAERSFRQAAALDPECAIAYWGMAKANRNNEKRAKAFIEKAKERKGNASRQEQLYIDAWAAYLEKGSEKKKERHEAYLKALDSLVAEFPNDLEAKALLALEMWNARGSGIPLNTNTAVDALLELVFQQEPMHPAHHYRIHLWDAPRPQKALASAAVCGQAAPGIAHMWHMSGHIYSRVRRYDDAAWQQEASARVDHAHMMRDRLLPDQIHNFAHNNEWLIRDLIFLGRARDAVSLAKNMIELPRHPKYNTLKGRGSSSYGRQRLIQSLREFELWDEALSLAETPYLEPTDQEDQQVARLRLLGTAGFLANRPEPAEAALADLQSRLAKLKEEEEGAAEEARKKAVEEKKSEKDQEKAAAEARKGFARRKESLEKGIAELEGCRHWAAGEAAPALEKLKQAGADKLLLARVEFEAGEQKKGIEAARKEVGSRSNQVLPLAVLADLQWRADDENEARETLKKLKPLCAAADLDTPPFARLEPIAAALGWSGDWRPEPAVKNDVGERPPLEQLGPFRWQPSPAPSWELPNTSGKVFRLEEMRGRPLVLIFYLGHGCLHCAEQLQKFAPKTSEFEAAGLALLAVSTDDLEGLKKSLANYDGGEIPFPLLADPKHEVFKAYRAYDDFEQQPLHGTFVIDGAGQVRWQDIGHEPFMSPEFVLEEAQRLLGFGAPAAADSAAE